jgi:hypothetical protein
MAYSSSEIISQIEKKYTNEVQPTIKNISDLNINKDPKLIYQYIFGVTIPDKYSEAIQFNWYEEKMRNELSSITKDLIFYGWPYHNDEIDDLKSVLNDLSDHFEANLDIDRMIKNAQKNTSDYYYLVVTIVPVYLMYAD